MGEDGDSRSPKKPLFAWRDAITESDLPPTTRHVLLTLSLHMDMDGGSCFPSQEKLSDETGLSERAVRTHLQAADADGWIDRQERGEGRAWRGHIYRPRVPDRPERGERDSPPERNSGEADSPPERVGGEPDAADVGKEIPPTSTSTSTGEETDTDGEVRSLRSLTSPLDTGDGDDVEEDSESASTPWGFGNLPNGEGFPSRFFLEGVKEVLWLGPTTPPGAPDGWSVRAELPDLKTAWDNLGTEGLVRRIWGLRLLADAGDLPGVEPGEGFTLALLNRLRGEGLWSDAEEAFRQHHQTADDAGLINDLAEDVLKERETDGA